MDDSERDGAPQGDGDAWRPRIRGPLSAIPPEAMGRFIAAESRLYPTALTDVDAYQRATSLVGLVARELRSDMDVDGVLGRRAELAGRLETLAAQAGLSLQGLPAEAVVDAASALRCRELEAAGGLLEPDVP
jgi:hypothetical protein